MKNWFKSLNPDSKCLFVLGLVNLVCCLIVLPISIACNLWGLEIGWAIGTLVSFISAFLTFVSSKSLMNKVPSVGGVIGAYFLKFFLYIGALVLCAVLQFTLHIQCFYWSCFTCVGSLTTLPIIIAIFHKEVGPNK